MPSPNVQHETESLVNWLRVLVLLGTFLIVAIRPSLDFEQIICPSAVRVNMDSSGAQDRGTLAPNLAGAACKSDCNCKHKTSGNCCNYHGHDQYSYIDLMLVQIFKWRVN